MSDKEKLQTLFEEFGVGFKCVDTNRVELEEGEPKIGGYSGFYTVFNFDKDGNFIGVRLWE